MIPRNLKWNLIEKWWNVLIHFLIVRNRSKRMIMISAILLIPENPVDVIFWMQKHRLPISMSYFGVHVLIRSVQVYMTDKAVQSWQRKGVREIEIPRIARRKERHLEKMKKACVVFLFICALFQTSGQIEIATEFEIKRKNQRKARKITHFVAFAWKTNVTASIRIRTSHCANFVGRLCRA